MEIIIKLCLLLNQTVLKIIPKIKIYLAKYNDKRKSGTNINSNTANKIESCIRLDLDNRLSSALQFSRVNMFFDSVFIFPPPFFASLYHNFVNISTLSVVRILRLEEKSKMDLWKFEKS